MGKEGAMRCSTSVGSSSSGHVDGLCGHAKEQPWLGGAPHPPRIPHPTADLPQLAAEITALRCWAAASPGKCKAEGQQDLPGASGAGSSAPIPSPTQRSTKDTKSLINRLLKLCGVRGGGTEPGVLNP